jgi:hypothetical protein
MAASKVSREAPIRASGATSLAGKSTTRPQSLLNVKRTQKGDAFKSVRLPVRLFEHVEIDAKVNQRSVPQQIEHLVLLAMGVEQNISLKEVLALKQKPLVTQERFSMADARIMLSDDAVQRAAASVAKEVAGSAAATYSSCPDEPKFVVQHSEGRDTVGTFNHGVFVPSLAHRQRKKNDAPPVNPPSKVAARRKAGSG